MPSLVGEIASISVAFSIMILAEASRLNNSQKIVSERKGNFISSIGALMFV